MGSIPALMATEVMMIGRARFDHAERRILDGEVPGGRNDAVADAAVTFQGNEHHRLVLDPPAAVRASGRDVKGHVDDDGRLSGTRLGVAASERVSWQQVLDDELAGQVRLQVLEQRVFERRVRALQHWLACVRGVVVIEP
jgi:hypothetical protein